MRLRRNYWLLLGLGIALALAWFFAHYFFTWVEKRVGLWEGLAGLMAVVYGLWMLVLRIADKLSPETPALTPAAEPRRSNVPVDVLRSEYLDQVFTEAGRVDLSAVDPSVKADEGRNAPRLESIYTSLRVQLRSDWKELRQQERTFERELPSAIAAIQHSDRVVLLGDPGSGKSTFVRFLAVCFAGQLAGRLEANFETLRQLLPNHAGQPGEKAESWELPAMLPLLVILRDFAEAGLPPRGVEATHEHLWAFLESKLPYAPALRERIASEGALVLFDGLDEVPAAEERREQLVSALQSFAAAHRKARIVVTSRPYAYQDKAWWLDGFEVAALAPFENGQIRRFVRLWYEDAGRRGALNAATAPSRAERLEAEIFRNPSFVELARRPLLLTLMASLHAFGGRELPEKREGLYAEMVDLLLYRWEAHRQRESGGRNQREPASLAEWLEVSKAELRRVLEHLAFDAHARHRGAETTADMPVGQLLERLKELGKRPGLRLDELEEYLRDRAGILVPRGETVYTFPHRSFQEYLAACHLTRGRLYPGRIASLVREEPERWREVALLAGAKACTGQQAPLWSLVEALCSDPQKEAMASAAVVWGHQIAGEAVAESGDLNDVADWDVEKLEALRQGLVTILTGTTLPAPERARAGRSLARLGDPRLEVTDLDAMRFCWVPAGPFVMGGNEYNDEKPQDTVDFLDYDFWMARFPVTGAQWRQYMELARLDVAYGELACLLGGSQPYSLGVAANEPVVAVSWHDALAFCAWLTERWRDRLPSGWSVQLPSEAEWEKAARGGVELPVVTQVLGVGEIRTAALDPGRKPNPAAAREYPWEGEASPERANYDETGIGRPSAVGAFAAGRSPFGCEELSGNVWEWTRSLWGPDWQRPAFGYPYRLDDEREDVSAGEDMLRVLRGGAYGYTASWVRCAYRDGFSPNVRFDNIGFRVLLSPHSLRL